MNGFLFEQIIFGPIRSRRLGISLGVNLLPLNKKHCTFNCLYCECGWTKPQSVEAQHYPSRQEIRDALQEKLVSMRKKKALLDTITFAGNGEPTLHREFAGIIDDTLSLRDTHYPQARIAVLSNASLAGKKYVANALLRVDQNILKLDAGTDATFQTINNPRIDITLDNILDNLAIFRGQLVIQSLFIRGTYKGKRFDNTTEDEVSAWLDHIRKLQPKLVMVYSIARDTPAETVERIDADTLLDIAGRVESLGIATEVYP